MISNNPGSLTNSTPPHGKPGEATAAHNLLKRTPGNYLLNQIYGLWFYISTFLLTIIITHSVSPRDYGVYAIAMTAFNTIQYIVAFGLEDATTTYVPRLLGEHGVAAAAHLMRRLLLLRFVILGVSLVVMLFYIPALGSLIALIPVPGAKDLAAGLDDPELLSHIMPIAVYVFGSGIGSLLNAVCAALMRMRIVLVIGVAIQALTLALGFVVLKEWGVNGMLWLLAIGSLFSAAAYLFWLFRVLFQPGAEYKQPLAPILHLGVSAWLTNLASGALLKQISIILLGVFAVSLIDIGYFNLSFQLADAASYLLVTGFGGVGGAALAAAFVGKNRDRLGKSWLTLIKVETLLAVTGLVFCLFNAENIAHVLYGSKYDPMGPLFAIFLFFNILVRLCGTTIHQLTLYVTGHAHWVVVSQWLGIGVALIGGILLIPETGPAGALIADGVAKTITGLFMLLIVLRQLPRRYPVELFHFTLRFLIALIMAALPSLLWHPNDQLQLILSGLLFLLLSLALLLWMKPLSSGDLEMLKQSKPRIAGYLRYFARLS